jgi:hypothetical protein
MPKGKRKKSGPIMLDIKMRYKGPAKPTRADVVAALEYMLATGGQVPAQWQFAAIDWSRPGSGTAGFRSGSIANFAQFSRLIEAKLADMKVSIDRKPLSDG